MHLIFFARGIFHQLNLFESLMQTHFWKWRRKNLKTGKQEEILVQGALRRSVLGAYEYVFPEEALAEVISMMGILEDNLSWRNFGSYTRLAVLRKLFGAKKIPHKIFEEAKKIPPSIILTNRERAMSKCKVAGVDLHIIGIKEDKKIAKELWGVEQEML